MPKAGLIGGGVIGGGWAARFLLNGWDVAVFDPDPETGRKLAEVLANARAALPALSDVPMPAEGRLEIADSIAEAVAGADYIQESVPERLDLKHRVYAEIQAASDAPVGSSTSGFTPSELQQGAARPGAIFVAHAFDPVYLLPLVELVPSPASDPGLIARARDVLAGLGMFPQSLANATDGPVGARLLAALWREALALVKQGVATTEEIDAAIAMGPGLGWAQMGLVETGRLTGGEAGMRHVLQELGPRVTGSGGDDDVMALIAGHSDAQSGHLSIRELERARDANLIGFLRVLKDRNWGAGRMLLEHDARLRQTPPEALPDSAAPMVMARMQVLPGWIDYNGHMTESRYLFACSETTDAFLRYIGAGMEYVAAGHSYYTAETHILHLGEAKLGDRLTGSLQVLGMDEKRLHVFVRIEREGRAVATLEQMLLHVDMAAGRACPADEAVLTRLRPIAEAHAGLPRPEVAGRHVGQRRG